jgi:molybdopterin-binding protein
MQTALIVMAHVIVRVGDNFIESVITRRSADELKLKKGDTVSAVVKSLRRLDPFH